MDTPYVSVIGSEQASEGERADARSVGKLLGERGYPLVCGGRGGVMAAAARGHQAGGGRPIGILPGRSRSEANEYLDVAIVTGLGSMRNALVVQNGDAVVAIGGRYGTLSEIALALDADIPVIGLDTHDIDGVKSVDNPAKAVETVEAIVESR